ncbi:FKBP-like peptidyl-prolyl cis-trans isomerase family protein [Euphorbia peplus]|nr:FKBP-like peptidyl-prolyl cis-trans isomerase family protein [Euphorbia peplus]
MVQIRFPSVFGSTSFTRRRCCVAMEMDEEFSSLKFRTFPRRLALKFVGFGAIVVSVNPVFAAPVPDMNEPEIIRTMKLGNGVRIQEIVEGEGPEAREGDLVEVNYVCRRSNGYFVHSTVDQFSGESSPVVLPLDDSRTIKGLKDVLIGMKVGGKRRALIPPSVGYINENLRPVPDEFGPRRSLLSHANEPLIFEGRAQRFASDQVMRHGDAAGRLHIVKPLLIWQFMWLRFFVR